MLLEETTKEYLKAQKSAPNQKEVGVIIMIYVQANFVISKSKDRSEEKRKISCWFCFHFKYDVKQFRHILVLLIAVVLTV